MNTKTNFKVRITPRAWGKIAGWRDACQMECSGLGLIRKQADIFTIYDATLPTQECTSGHTEIDRGQDGTVDAISSYMQRCYKMGTPLDHIKLWWHTHANFGCFWSGEDEETSTRLAGKGGEYVISIVTNHANEYLCRLDMFKPFRTTFDGVEIEWIKGAEPRNKDWKYQVKQKVREKVYTPYIPPAGSFTNHMYGRWYEGNDLSPMDMAGERWWEREIREEQEKLSRLNPDTPPEQKITYKWYDEYLKRKHNNKVEEDKQTSWVNHGGQLMSLERYRKEVLGIDDFR